MRLFAKFLLGFVLLCGVLWYFGVPKDLTLIVGKHTLRPKYMAALVSALSENQLPEVKPAEESESLRVPSEIENEGFEKLLADIDSRLSFLERRPVQRNNVSVLENEAGGKVLDASTDFFAALQAQIDNLAALVQELKTSQPAPPIVYYSAPVPNPNPSA